MTSVRCTDKIEQPRTMGDERFQTKSIDELNNSPWIVIESGSHHLGDFTNRIRILPDFERESIPIVFQLTFVRVVDSFVCGIRVRELFRRIGVVKVVEKVFDVPIRGSGQAEGDLHELLNEGVAEVEAGSLL